MQGKRIFITGGAGYLGKNLIKKWYNDNEITVYSRDEAKHYFLKKEFPRVRFIIGDIRNEDHLKIKSKGHDIGIFAASLKQIEACEDNYEEATEIIVRGAFNSKLAAIENNFESACFISSDKSICPTTIYGMCKALAGEAFITDNICTSTKLSTAIYGNIANSTGSIIPLIWDSIKHNRVMQQYGADMTRFILTINDAINLIERSLDNNNVNVAPVARSFKISDMFEIYANEFNLKYTITTPRENEKIHELMASSEHMPRMQYISEGNYYKFGKRICTNSVKLINNEYSSRDHCFSRDELYSFLATHNFYKNEA